MFISSKTNGNGQSIENKKLRVAGTRLKMIHSCAVASAIFSRCSLHKGNEISLQRINGKQTLLQRFD